jgi:hypothetical protein
MALLLRNKLVFPGGLAGLNYAHPAALGIAPNLGNSVVSRGGNLISLINGAPATMTVQSNGCVSTVLGNLGPVTGVPNFNASSYSWSGQSTATPPGQTGALIGFWPGVPSAGDSPMRWGINTGILTYTSSHFTFIWNGGLYDIGFAPVAGVPYFIAVSGCSSTIVNMVVTNLKTGAINTFTSSTSIQAAAAFSATPTVCNSGPGGSLPMQGYVAAAMWSPSFLSMAQLLAWARDPWTFWYPGRRLSLIVDSLSRPPTGSDWPG